jgi:hypothetical protein
MMMKSIPYISSLIESRLFSVFDIFRTKKCLYREALRPIELFPELSRSILQDYRFRVRFINE